MADRIQYVSSGGEVALPIHTRESSIINNNKPLNNLRANKEY